MNKTKFKLLMFINVMILITLSFTLKVNAVVATAPIVTTNAVVTNLLDVSVTVGGEVTSDGGATVTERGVCYATTSTPTILNSKVICSGTTGSFTVDLSGLTQTTTYYMRAYAINSKGTSYGSDVSFTTPTPIPRCEITASTGNITSVSSIKYTVTFYGDVTGFDATDIIVTNGINGTFTALSGNTYTLIVTNNGNCTQTVTVNAGVCTNIWGNSNTSGSKTVIIDTSHVGERLQEMPVGTKIMFGGRQFALLDPSTGYVVSQKNVAEMAFDADDTILFNPSDSNNIGYYLNNTYYSTFTAADQALIQDSTWYRGYNGSEATEMASSPAEPVTAKVGLLRETEYATAKTAGIFPSSGDYAQWWLLTPVSATTWVDYVYRDGMLDFSPTSSIFGVRPSFRISTSIIFTRDDYSGIYYYDLEAPINKTVSGLNIGNTIMFHGEAWRVVSPSTGLVVSDRIIETRAFDTTTIPYTQIFDPAGTTYGTDNIGYYLNNAYYNTFTIEEKTLIKDTIWNINTDVGTRPPQNTSFPNPTAKIGLLTESEYATAKTAGIFPSDGEYASWWMITPYASDARYVRHVYSGGWVGSEYANLTFGVRPTFQILESQNVVSTEPGVYRIFDNVVQTVPIVEIGLPSVTTTKAGPTTYTAVYTGADTVTLVEGNITLNKTGTANGTITVTNGTTNTPTVTISSITGDGTLGISIAAGTASNAEGTSAGAGPSTTFIVDNTSPTVTVAANTSDTTIESSVIYTFEFSQIVTGFDITDITVTNGTKGTFTAVDGNTYTLVVTNSGACTQTVTVEAGVCIDVATNPNTSGSKVIIIVNVPMTKIQDMAAGSRIIFSDRQWIVIDQATGLLVSPKSISRKAFDVDNTQIYSPSDNNNIGYYLNNTYYNTFTVAQKAIIKDSTWNIGNESNETGSSVTTKIGLLRESEYNAAKTAGIFNAGGEYATWWLITPYSSDGTNVRIVSYNGTASSNGASSTSGLRPALRILETTYFFRDTFSGVYYYPQ
ncbi:MAG TPA: hypothetical protein DEP72_04865 [Clostridiales bacterium]|nr:hypothetical protein [Clostridiales bacterium]